MLLSAATAAPVSVAQPILKAEPRTPTYDAWPKDSLPSTAERASEKLIGTDAGNFRYIGNNGNSLILAGVGIAIIFLVVFSKGK